MLLLDDDEELLSSVEDEDVATGYVSYPLCLCVFINVLFYWFLWINFLILPRLLMYGK